MSESNFHMNDARESVCESGSQEIVVGDSEVKSKIHVGVQKKPGLTES